MSSDDPTSTSSDPLPDVARDPASSAAEHPAAKRPDVRGEDAAESSAHTDPKTSSAKKAPRIDELIRRRGLISGWLIAWPFLVLTLIACAIAATFQWMQRPQLVLFTIGLYLCMAFFAHAYSVAWQTGKHVRQMLAMIAVVLILVALIALHLDDGSARWVYRDGQRILRPRQPLLRLAVALDMLAIIVILSHGLGLGFGHRFFHRESGMRVSRSMVRDLLRDVRNRFRGDS